MFFPLYLQVTLDTNKEYHGVKSGMLLKADKVLQGRQRELDNILKHKVKIDILIAEAKRMIARLTLPVQRSLC